MDLKDNAWLSDSEGGRHCYSYVALQFPGLKLWCYESSCLWTDILQYHLFPLTLHHTQVTSPTIKPQFIPFLDTFGTLVCP